MIKALPHHSKDRDLALFCFSAEFREQLATVLHFVFSHKDFRGLGLSMSAFQSFKMCSSSAQVTYLLYAIAFRPSVEHSICPVSSE